MKQNNIFNPDVLFEQMTAISKAAAYDAILPKYQEMEVDIIKLKGENEQLKIQLKYANERIRIHQEFINEVRPKDAELIPLGAVDQEIEDELNNRDDLQNVL